MLEIYWIKQKVVGLLVLVLPFIFAGVLIDLDAAVVWLLTVPLGLYYILAKDQMFYCDYVLEIDILKLVSKKGF